MGGISGHASIRHSLSAIITLYKSYYYYYQAAVALYFHCVEFSALPETDGAARSLYHYIALGPGGVQDRQFYRDINDTEGEHLPEDIIAHVEERRADVAVLIDRCSND